MIQVRGMSSVRQALSRVSAEGEKVASREVIRAALNIQAGAKERVPVDTGRLRNSIAVAEHEANLQATEDGPAQNQIRSGMLSAVVGTNVEYAPHVEFGTYRMRARPYLFPAAEEERPKLLERLRLELGEAFVKARDG